MTKKYLLVITHSTDDHDRANGAVGMAVSLLGDGADLALFFVFEGAKMAHRGVAETIEGDISRVTLVTASRYVSRGIRQSLNQWRDNDWRWERFGQMVTISNGDLFIEVPQ